MHDLLLFLKAALLGLAVAAPPGPIAALCIGRTLRHGRRQGFILGGGVAAADTLVAGVVALGLGAILAFISAEHFWLQLVGGIVVAGFGIALIRAKPHLGEGSLDASRFAGLFATGFLVTLSNPVTYAAFAGVIGALGLIPVSGGWIQALVVASGVFAGSMVWWTLLVLCAGFFRQWLDERHVRWIHRVLGAALFLVGTLAFCLSVAEWFSA